MRLTFLAVTLFASLGSLATGCTDSPSTAPPRVALAQVCVVAVDPVADAVAKPAVVDAPTDTVTPTPDPTPDPPGEPTLPIACCTTGSCTPMDYPIDICTTLPEAVDAVTLGTPSVQPYDGTAVPVAYYGECEGGGGGGDQCEAGDGAYVLTVGTAVAAVTFDSPTQIRVYDLEDNVGAVKAPDGALLHAVVRADNGFADFARPVRVNGQLIGYLNLQTDCLPTECGYSCNIC